MESESDPLTHRPVDLFEKEPLKGKWEIHTPTKFGEDPSKDLGGDREQTNAYSNYSMILFRRKGLGAAYSTTMHSPTMPSLHCEYCNYDGFIIHIFEFVDCKSESTA